MGRRLTPAEFGDLLRESCHEVFRIEAHPTYLVDHEQRELAAFLRGARPALDEIPHYASWYQAVRDVTARGCPIRRVRIIDEPPSDYQRFAIWSGRFNVTAGETLSYLPRSRAREIGFPDTRDWWLYDSTRLLLMDFDPDGRPVGSALVDDPALVSQHRTWKDLALAYSTEDPEH